MTSRKDIPAGGATGPGPKKPRPLGLVDPNSVRVRGFPKSAAVEEHALRRQAILGEPNAAAAAADVASAQGEAQALALAQTQAAAAQAAAAAPQSHAQRQRAAPMSILVELHAQGGGGDHPHGRLPVDPCMPEPPFKYVAAQEGIKDS